MPPCTIRVRLHPDSHLWYWACRNWNSSLIRSQDSVTVNLNGCPGWCGTSTPSRQHAREERNNWATRVTKVSRHAHTHMHTHRGQTVDDNRPLCFTRVAFWFLSLFLHVNPRTLTHTHTHTHIHTHAAAAIRQWAQLSVRARGGTETWCELITHQTRGCGSARVRTRRPGLVLPPHSPDAAPRGTSCSDLESSRRFRKVHPRQQANRTREHGSFAVRKSSVSGRLEGCVRVPWKEKTSSDLWLVNDRIKKMKQSPFREMLRAGVAPSPKNLLRVILCAQSFQKISSNSAFKALTCGSSWPPRVSVSPVSPRCLHGVSTASPPSRIYRLMSYSLRYCWHPHSEGATTSAAAGACAPVGAKFSSSQSPERNCIFTTITGARTVTSGRVV